MRVAFVLAFSLCFWWNSNATADNVVCNPPCNEATHTCRLVESPCLVQPCPLVPMCQVIDNNKIPSISSSSSLLLQSTCTLENVCGSQKSKAACGARHSCCEWLGHRCVVRRTCRRNQHVPCLPKLECPPRDPRSSGRRCADDDYCTAPGQLCCRHTCLKGVLPLQCPSRMRPPKNCIDRCATDDDCKNEQLCCSIGCSKLCVLGVRPEPIKVCPEIRKCHRFKNCKDDTDCDDGQLCCPLCGGRCVDGVPLQDTY